MDQELELMINDRPQRVPAGITVAAALARAGFSSSRQSHSGEPRAPFCGMGLCQECRVMIDGQGHQRGLAREAPRLTQKRKGNPAQHRGA